MVGGERSEARKQYRIAAHIFGLQGFEEIQIGVVSLGLVLQRVLDELEAGQAGIVERDVIRRAGGAWRHVGHAEIAQRLYP